MNNIVLNEAYFGEQPELTRALELLSEFRRKYAIKGRLISSCNSDPLLEKFDDIIADFFGFKSFFLHVYHQMMVDAHTASCRYKLITSSNSHIRKTSKGYKYDGKISAIVSISTYLIFSDKFSDREVMGIILHEIGHNFSDKFSPAIDVYSKLNLIISLPYTVLSIITKGNVEMLAGLSQSFTEFWIKLNKNEVNATVFNGLDFLLNLPKNILTTFINSIPGVMGLNIIGAKLHANDLINIPIGYLDEHIADNFATMYGFGPDLITGLEKLNIKKSDMYSILTELPLLGWFVTLLDVPTQWAASLIDEHPINSSRRKAQYNYLLREMKKANLPPRLRNDIAAELNRMEHDMQVLETDIGKYGGKLFRAKYNKFINKLKNGADPRELIINSDMTGDIIDRVSESFICDLQVMDII